MENKYRIGASEPLIGLLAGFPPGEWTFLRFTNAPPLRDVAACNIYDIEAVSCGLGGVIVVGAIVGLVKWRHNARERESLPIHVQLALDADGPGDVLPTYLEQ